MFDIQSPHFERTPALTMVRHQSSLRERRPRLLIVGPLPPPYIGPAVATQRLLRSPILNSRFDVSFFDSSDRDGTEDIGELSLHNIVVALRHGFGFLRALARERPDVVYVPIARGFWGLYRDLEFLLPARLCGCATVVHLRAGRFDIIHDKGRLGRLVARAAIGRADRAIALGESLRGVFGEVVERDRVRVVPNGVDLDSWPRVPRTGLSSTGTIACLTNIFPDKGVHVLIEAMPAVLAAAPYAHLEIAGEVKDRPYYEGLLRRVEELGLADAVRFVGAVDESQKRAFLAQADVAAFVPVQPEGLPWVVLEAMASSLPVVGTPQGTMVELIDHGRTGFLVPPEDAAAAASRLIELLTDDPLRERMACAARRRLEARYTEETAHARLADVIEESVQRRHPD